jgi:hypothetical protein
MIRNPFYCGRLVRCGESFAGEHEAMITSAEYETLQLLARRGNLPRPQNHEHPFLYRGLLSCGHCGRMLTGERVKGRFVYYRCSRRKAGREVCRPPAPSENQVTAVVKESLGRLKLPSQIIDWSLRAVELMIQRERERLARELRRHEADLAAAQRTLDGLTDLRLAGDLTDAEYRARRPGLLSRLDDAKRDLDDPTERLEQWRTAIAQMFDFGSAALTTFELGDDNERRRLISDAYANCPVTNRMPAPVLRFPYSLVLEAPQVGSGDERPDANRLPPPEWVLHLRENARPGRGRERAFVAWCTRLEEVRTHVPRSPDR